MSHRTRQADKTLRSLQKRRSSPACYPCFKRKVRCQGGRPCESCLLRNHPEICHVEHISQGSRRHPRGNSRSSTLPETQDLPTPSENSVPDVGRLSAANFVRNELQSGADSYEASPAMVLSHSSDWVDSLILGGTAQSGIEQALPSRVEVLQYYPPFQSFVMPIYPIMPNTEAAETWIADILSHDKDSQSIRLEPQKVAVILACLALGAQFLETQTDDRWQVSQNFLMRSSAIIFGTNCILQPSLEAIQAFLMIGIALQNLGRSDGAWNLLGLTYRLAQSLGLHKLDDLPCGSGEGETKRGGSMLWTAIIWQDALLSLRYDRRPITQVEPGTINSWQEALTNLPYDSYFEGMKRICWVTIHLFHAQTSSRCDPHTILERVKVIEGIVSSGQSYLSPQCTTRTLTQRFQFFALRLHSSLTIAETCRPGFASSENDEDDDPLRRTIRQKGIKSLVVALEAYLELYSFSNVPLRLWSLTQAAISCGLVLALLDLRRPCAIVRTLLQRLIDSLRQGGDQRQQQNLSTATSDSSVPKPGARARGLDMMREKSVALLCSILKKSTAAHCLGNLEEATIPTTNIVTVPTITAREDQLTQIDDENAVQDQWFDEFLNWPSDLSLFDSAFPESVLHAHLEDA